MIAAASSSLSALLSTLALVPPPLDCTVRGVTLDSREVRPGDLFLAVPGAASDGRRFISDAIARGAAAIAYEPTVAPLPADGIPVIAVPALKTHLGLIADRFYGHPSRRLRVIGVTGTNGKTTCAHLLAQALVADHRACAVIGTVGNGFPGALTRASHTTPDAVRLHRLFADYLAAGATHVSMEVSSHALDQGRVDATAFTGAVFTNLTQDHLDYHGDMRAYGEAKARLFAFPDLRFAVINIDDEFGRTLSASLSPRVQRFTYGFEQGDVQAPEIRPRPTGLEMCVQTSSARALLRSPLLGRFNAANLLAVLSALLALGFDLDTAVARLETARPVAGRMECFGREGAPIVVVDYAHTPDALEKVLLALREHAPPRLWCIFGCGGDRDRSKRPLMGRVAESLADEVILTDDNPRTESPQQIIADIRTGMRHPPRVERDRRAAIRLALAEAQAGEVILLAGKGHEDYQQVGETRLAYSDRDTVRELLGVAA